MSRGEITRRPGVPDAEHDTVEMVAAHLHDFEEGIGRDFRDRCNHFYRLWRGYKQFRYAWEAAGPNDRDGVLLDAKSTWGSNLHIPLTFRTVETMVPRAIAQRPGILVLPRDPAFEHNVRNVKMTLEVQQEQVDIELSWQDVMRQAMIYGLGVGKSFWRTEYAPRQQVVPRLLNKRKFKLGPLTMEKEFDDPDFEDVDIFDWMWDPYGCDLNRGSNRCRWAAHRLWMGADAIMDRIESGAWNSASVQALDSDDLRSMSTTGPVKYDDVWQDRMQASGMNSFQNAARGDQPHEVIEFHDGHQIITILDRTVQVAEYTSPCAGVIPFHIYRPTRVPKQMVGIGEIEPIQHLSRELDILRSQRRDAATIALCAGYAFDEGAVDREDLVFGPAAAIAVRNSRPGDAILPLQRNDIPGSGYQEEQVIKSDIDAVAGITDAMTGGEGGTASTATEAQLVQAAVSVRVELKSRRFEVEVCRTVGRVWHKMNQRQIIESRAPIRRPDPDVPEEQAYAEGRWKWYPQGPNELAGEFEFQIEGGTLAAQNVQQMRQDAMQLMNLFANDPSIDGRRLRTRVLQLYGEKDPETWFAPQQQPVSPGVFGILEKMGFDPVMIQHAIAMDQAQTPLLNSAGPDQQQAAQLMAASPDEMPVAA